MNNSKYNDNLWEKGTSDELPPRYCSNCGAELDLCICPKQECDNPQCPCHYEEEPW
jgi:hypothetical protein